MKSNRRNFLKTATVAGAGAFTGRVLSGCTPKQTESNLAVILDSVKKSHSPKFNMSGYAAPALACCAYWSYRTGRPGKRAVQRLSYIEGVEIKALCDKREVAVKESQKYLTRIGRPAAREFFGDENAWKKLIELAGS